MSNHALTNLSTKCSCCTEALEYTILRTIEYPSAPLSSVVSCSLCQAVVPKDEYYYVQTCDKLPLLVDFKCMENISYRILIHSGKCILCDDPLGESYVKITLRDAETPRIYPLHKECGLKIWPESFFH